MAKRSRKTLFALRWLAVGLVCALVVPALAAFVAGCYDPSVLLLWPLADYVINRSRSDRTTRYIYQVVADIPSRPPIAGATIQLFALRTGGQPDNPEDYEAVADAVRMTNQNGEAEVRVLASPNVPGDNVIRPGTVYREVVSAPGFQSVVNQRSAVELNQGPIELPPILLTPLSASGSQ